MHNDALEIEYREVYAQMKGISPKLQIYRDLEMKLSIIKERMGGKSASNMGKFLSRKDNRIVKVKKGSSSESFSGRIIEEKQTICNKPGCTNKRKGAGRTKSGLPKYRTRCAKHMKEDKENGTFINED